MFGKNNKVPVAVLSCFLIAFILQGVLKISGVFIFEKALTWEIFEFIDNHQWATLIYQCLINIIAVYCMSFALTSSPYSKKWYHYVLMLTLSCGITILRTLVLTPMYLEYILDIVLYVLLPVFINVTSSPKYRLFDVLNVGNVVTLTSVQISLYLAYLGLCYWSSMLSSFIIMSQIILYSSAYFLIFFEMYIGLVLMMLSLNIFISNQKKENDYD